MRTAALRDSGTEPTMASSVAASTSCSTRASRVLRCPASASLLRAERRAPRRDVPAVALRAPREPMHLRRRARARSGPAASGRPPPGGTGSGASACPSRGATARSRPASRMPSAHSSGPAPGSSAMRTGGRAPRLSAGKRLPQVHGRAVGVERHVVLRRPVAVAARGRRDDQLRMPERGEHRAHAPHALVDVVRARHDDDRLDEPSPRGHREHVQAGRVSAGGRRSSRARRAGLSISMGLSFLPLSCRRRQRRCPHRTPTASTGTQCCSVRRHAVGRPGGSTTRTQQPATPTHVTVLPAEIRKPSANAPGAALVVTPCVVVTDPQPAGAGGADGVVADVTSAIVVIGRPVVPQRAPRRPACARP